MYDVITMGSATVDIFAVCAKGFKEPKPGDKVLIDKLDVEVGGGGVNSAIAFSRMGLRVAFLGKVGLDHNAVNIIHTLKKEKVDFLHLKTDKDLTSYSFVLMSKKSKDRILYTYKGASDHLSIKDVDFKKLKETRWIYMATLMHEAFKTAEKVAAFAKKKGIKLMFNPSSYLAVKGKSGLKKILQCTNILVLNKSEAQLMLKTKHSTIKYLLKELRKLGPEIAVITDGANGTDAYDGKEFRHQKASKTKVVSTAGAGDAFASGFLAGIIKERSIEKALQVGNANACSVIQYYGTKNKLLSYNQAKRFIKKC